MNTVPQNDEAHRGLVNPPWPAGRYQLLDRNSDPAGTSPGFLTRRCSTGPTTHYCKEGS
ncbi:hypothetical protein ACLQ3D_10680 [Micromonospora vinacea]|uniref:Uncharacterized protein n=1 Tax=Micromonospora vinacea TaxID=709878 RepID=A0ABS0KCL9_9ACTN|nr:hypothetical protein [Micromonospora vinacea]MBG6105923.1 hypothetical protein [Micromonospora vinacea]WSZ77925.1 hypothetical protein OH804_05390 [Micromonospora sp. NBC_00860]WTA65643.1 hypothetical protein OHB51_24465 [Micromonospora sp. NBC_00855]